jgi:hydrogenase maturation protein HypF
VGFRPFVYRIARAWGLAGWVRNAESGVEIHVEGSESAVAGFLRDLRARPPPAASIAAIETEAAPTEGHQAFEIRASQGGAAPTTRISPDLPLCGACRRELFDPRDRRFQYPYINCTDCGPRYTIVQDLPYDRGRTTMRDWLMCADCAREYHDPGDRRFHAQPVACPRCGPSYWLRLDGVSIGQGEAAIRAAAGLLSEGKILAIKSLGGYHLAGDARNPATVQALRRRKFRQEKPFALMARDLDLARAIVELSKVGERLLASIARPIVLAPARVTLPDVAPDNPELGVMLPYAPVHDLLFAAGAPDVLVLTSANRSDEPIAYADADAFERLDGLADAFLVGERPIARRVDDSVARDGPFGRMVLRRARGYAPAAVAALPSERPILSVGGDLKSSVTLVVAGQALVSHHLGDLGHHPARAAFRETIDDLCRMYEVRRDDLLVVHDAHPDYASTRDARSLPGDHLAVQHHRAHVASVLAERGAWETRVVGFAFDGTGYGDDGTIWGGEVFVGSLRDGLTRVAHLRPAALPGGDAAARYPVQAAAGFLAQLPDRPDLAAAPFGFPDRFRWAERLVARDVRTFSTTSVGRLFDAAAALVGFTRATTFEGQAAIWLEHLARAALPVPPYPFPFDGRELDFRPLLAAIVADRRRGRDVAEIARAFHEAVARAIVQIAGRNGTEADARAIVLSGGVFQNVLLLERIRDQLAGNRALEVWVNREVPPNDGGISLGQAALGAMGTSAPGSSS